MLDLAGKLNLEKKTFIIFCFVIIILYRIDKVWVWSRP